MGDTNIARLKKNTEKVFLDFDKCEFKSGTYSHEINDPNLESVKLIAPSSTLALLDSKISETVIQSYLTYTDDIKGEKAIFTSQSFPFDTITLKYHVLNKNVALYINRLDSRIYLFELNK